MVSPKQYLSAFPLILDGPSWETQASRCRPVDGDESSWRARGFQPHPLRFGGVGFTMGHWFITKSCIYIYIYIFWRFKPKRISYGGNIVDISALSHPGSYPSHQWLGNWTCIFRISRFTWGGLSCARTGAGKDYGILSGPVPQCLAQELGRGLQIVVWRPAGGWEPISRRENPVPWLGLRAHCWFGSSLLLGYPNIHREWSRLIVLIFWS